MPQLTWLVNGCSSGIGEQFVIGILARGDRVIATARKDISRLKHLENGGAAVFELDVTSPASEITSKMTEIIKIYDGVDVSRQQCRLYRGSHEQYLAQFNTNLFGVVKVTQALLPHFRQKRSGYVIFVGSSGGWAGSPGASPYCGTKFALEGIYECMKSETAEFGVKSIVFELGLFRTKIMAPGNVRQEPSQIEDYTPIAQAVGPFTAGQNGNQDGDLSQAVSIMIDVVRGEGVAEGRETPERLPLGPDMLGVMRKKCTDSLKIYDEWEKVIASTNFGE